MKRKTGKPLTISIVTYNSADTIGDCLLSLKNQSYQVFDLIIVDNGSTDNTFEVIKNYYPAATMISSLTNVGYGGGHNLSIGRTSSPWVLLLNTDLELEANAIELMMNETGREKVAAIGPLLYRNKDKQLLDAAGLVKTIYNNVYDRGQNKPMSKRFSKPQTVWGISGACVLYRRSALEDVAYSRQDRAYNEYLDEDFFMYKEDVDLAARLNKKGWSAYYLPTAIGYHERTWKASMSIAETVNHRKERSSFIKRCSYRNHWYFLIKNLTLFQLFPTFIYESMKFLYLCLFERTSLGGLSDVYVNYSRIVKKRYV